MQVERTDKEIIIRLLPSVDTDELLNYLNCTRYKKLTSTFRISQKSGHPCESNKKDWWSKNRHKFIR